MGTIEWPVGGPETDVWNHLHTGYEQAAEELFVLPEELRSLTEKLGSALIGLRTRMVLDAGQERVLELDEALLEEPWVRHAADLDVASEGIRRATNAIDRYLELKPVTAARTLPEQALPYVKEVVRTYMFGFDPACIALCRAALEQVLKDVLVAKAIYTQRRLRAEQPTASTLLMNARREGLLTSAFDAADRVRKHGDTLMHKHIYEAKILKQVALQSIQDFTEAACELLAAD